VRSSKGHPRFVAQLSGIEPTAGEGTSKPPEPPVIKTYSVEDHPGQSTRGWTISSETQNVQDPKKTGITMARAGVAAAAAVLRTVALSVACAAQPRRFPRWRPSPISPRRPSRALSGSISRVTSGAEMLHVTGWTFPVSEYARGGRRLRRVYLSDPNMLNW